MISHLKPTAVAGNVAVYKSGRKLQGGDRLRFIAIGSSGSNEVRIIGAVQFFLKT